MPLRLCWALIVWRAQGQTIRGRFVVMLGPIEKSHGLTYTIVGHCNYWGLTRERIMEKIPNGKGMKLRIN
jgi:hypothetical protein